MCRRKIAILYLVMSICLISQTTARETKQVNFTGKVVDAEDRPVGGARVRLYEMVYGQTAYSYDTRLAEQITTRTDGTFSFSVSAETDSYRHGYIVTEKEGLALGCCSWDMQKDEQVEIKLGQPKELAGVVVDESGKAVSGADVSISLLIIGKVEEDRGLSRHIASKLLTASTDAAGKFKFTNLPAEATVELLIKKPGRATINTYNREIYRGGSLQFSPGQTDIKLTQPVEARIEGMTVEKVGGKPIGGIKVAALQKGSRPYFREEPVVSKEDGTFRINALIAGKYVLELVRPRDELADWVAEQVEVTAEAGRTRSDVKVELCRGGILEVVVTEAVSKQPLAKASVSVRDERNNRWLSARCDEEGIARIRLMPGGFQLSGIYKQGYASDQRQEPITIEEGATKRFERTLSEMPKINGIVRDGLGKPAEGVSLKILPGGREETTSDSEGKFEVIWDRRGWADEEDTVFCLVARQEQRNLAAAIEIGKDTKRLDIKLEPGVTFAGKVVDPNGKGIPGAQVRMMLRVSNWGSSLSREQVTTDDSGNYEISAIPAGRNYNVSASAGGYGEKDIDAHTENAVDNRLNIETLTLPLANLSVSGQIVDTQGNPVAHAEINCSGEGQPDLDVDADKDGKFILDGVCAGKVRIRVDATRDAKRLSAHVFTDAGAIGIKITVRERRSAIYFIRTKTIEQIVQSSDYFIAGLTVDENGSPVAGVPVGVCCIKREREKGKFSWTFSSYHTLSDITDEQGRFAIELEEDAEYNLRFSPDKQAAIIVYDIPVGKKDLKVTLPEGGTVIGRLLRTEKSQKVPIPHAEVKIEQPNRAAYTHLGFDRDRTTITDAEGRFRFEHLRTKIRPSGSTYDQQWKYAARVWEISYGNTSKTIAFYDSTTIEDLELVVRPDPAQALPLVGKALPRFEGIKINLTEDQAKGKKMLVCFWDMEQRPSRNCLLQLSKRAQELKAKDVVVIAVQASKVNKDSLNEWIKKQNITFPIGIIEDDVEKTRFTWSVKSLPWLILTDTEHIVAAEGFSINELDERIKG